MLAIFLLHSKRVNNAILNVQFLLSNISRQCRNITFISLISLSTSVLLLFLFFFYITIEAVDFYSLKISILTYSVPKNIYIFVSCILYFFLSRLYWIWKICNVLILLTICFVYLFTLLAETYLFCLSMQYEFYLIVKV